MGAINHIRYGGNPFESSSMLGGIPGYLPLYGILCAGFCNLLNLDTMHGMLYFSIILFIVASFIWFLLFRFIFKNDWIALIGMILANPINSYPILKYTPFTQKIMIPLFILALYLTFTKRNNIYYAFLGLIYGLLALSHTVAFVGATIILIVFLLYDLHKNRNKLVSYLKENIKGFLIFLVLSIPILMLYWYKPIFIYHLHTAYDRIHMDTPDFGNFQVQTWFLFDVIKKYLINFNSLTSIIYTILTWIGIYSLFYYNDESKEFIKIFIISSIIATFSYFVTEPLLKINFIPTYMEGFYLWISSLLIIEYGLKFILANLIKKYNFTEKKVIVTFSFIFLILFANSAFGFINYINNNKWANVAKKPIPKMYLSLQKYILENTNVNDVFLSTKELSFMINSLTGRKVLVNRWAQQNDPYIPLYKRDMDAAIILYGNDTKKKIELLKKYHVKYLYWDYYWISSEFQFDRYGRIIGIFDPLMTYDTKENREYLDKYGVKYIPLYFWVDPACRGDKIRKYHLLIISPQNYYNFTHPWKPDLDKYLVEVWNYTYNGKKIAALYKIKLNN